MNCDLGCKFAASSREPARTPGVRPWSRRRFCENRACWHVTGQPSSATRQIARHSSFWFAQRLALCLRMPQLRSAMIRFQARAAIPSCTTYRLFINAIAVQGCYFCQSAIDNRVQRRLDSRGAAASVPWHLQIDRRVRRASKLPGVDWPLLGKLITLLRLPPHVGESPATS